MTVSPGKNPWVDPPDSPPRTASTEASAESRRRVLAVGFGVVSLTILALLVLLYSKFLAQILWAGSLAVLFYPVHARILRGVGGRDTAAAVISTLVSLILIFVPAGFVGLAVMAEVRDLWPNVREALAPEQVARAAAWLETSSLRPLLRLLMREGAGDVELQGQIQTITELAQTWLTERLRLATLGLPAAIYQGALTLLAFFFFLRHGPGWIENLEAVLPLEQEYSRRLTRIAAQTINAVFRGVLLTAFAQAILAGFGFVMAGAPFPILLGCVTFVAALIPFVGPAAIWLPTSLGIYLDGRPGTAIGLALWGLLVVSLVDNFLRPYLIGRDTKLPLLWLFLSMLGGVKWLGVLGVIVGPAVLALAIACLRIWREGRKLPVSPDGGGA